MAYTDFTFYENTYHGNVIPADDFERIADRASDFLDVITFDRLIDGLPDNDRAKTKVQKAVCAVAEKLYELELADKQALSAAAGGTSSSGSGGATSGVITSRSAGSESISYASPSEMANGAKTWSAVYQAAGDETLTNNLLYSAARLYLTGVRDDNGELLDVCWSEVEMVRLFISQPMKGKTDEEILRVREKAIASAKAKIAEGEEVEVIDSFFQNAPADARPLWFLGKSLELLSTADVAYFAKGWEDARGCRIENTCAIEYGIDVIEDYTED